MNCSNCERPLREESTFCSHCGQVVAVPSRKEGEVAEPPTVNDSRPAIVDEHDSVDDGTLVDDNELVDDEEPKESEVAEVAAIAPADKGTVKNFKTVWLISFFGGWLGLDRFYLGHIGTGVLKLLGLGWYGIWWSIDMIRLLRGKQSDKNGTLVTDSDNFMPVARVISTIVLTLIALCWVIVILAAGNSSESD